MGIFKGFKDLTDMAHAAPGLIAQTGQLAEAAKTNGAAQQAAGAQYMNQAPTMVRHPPAEPARSPGLTWRSSPPSPVPLPRSATTRHADRNLPPDTASERNSGRPPWTGGTPASPPIRRWPPRSTSCTPDADMGLFKDLGDTKREARKLSRNSPPVADSLGTMVDKMSALTNSLESSTVGLAPSPGSVPVEARLMSVEPTGQLNGDPIVTVSVLVLMNGSPPIPITQSIVVPAVHGSRLQPGVQLPARIDPHDLETFALDWNAPVF